MIESYTFSSIMLFSKSSSEQANPQHHKSILSTAKLRHVTAKILHKLKLSKNDAYMNLNDSDSAEAPFTKIITHTRPTAAVQIIDIKLMRQNIRPQPRPRINTLHPGSSCSQATLKSPELRLQTFFESGRSAAAETGTPLRRNPQQAYIFEETSHRSSAAVLDDILNYEGYDFVGGDDEDEDGGFVDWGLLDLPEKVYGRLANESRHSLL